MTHYAYRPRYAEEFPNHIRIALLLPQDFAHTRSRRTAPLCDFDYRSQVSGVSQGNGSSRLRSGTEHGRLLRSIWPTADLSDRVQARQAP